MDAMKKYPLFAELSYNASNYPLLYSVKPLELLLGYEPGELAGKRFDSLIVPAFAEEQSALIVSTLESAGEIEMIIPVLTKSGEPISLLIRGRVEDGYVRGVLVRCDKIQALLKAEAARIEEYRSKLSDSENMVNSLTVRAEKDSLTGLLNAGTTRSLCEEYLAEGEKGCALIVIDVDDFKQINDRFGHMVGDKVMCCAAYTIKKLFRSGDVVGRVGGDEFLVLMKDVTDRSIAEMRCSQIVKAFSEIECEQIDGHRLSCSVGAALAPDHGNAYNALFCRADSAMYRAKRSGGNKYIIED